MQVVHPPSASFSHFDEDALIQVNQVYQANYFGCALTRGGTNEDMECLSERAVRRMLNTGVRPLRVALVMAGNSISLANLDKNRTLLSFNVREMRCFSRHRDHRSGKPKLISMMTVNRFTKDKNKPYQCIMIHFHTTAEADSFCYMLNYMCQELFRKQRQIDAARAATLNYPHTTDDTGLIDSAPPSPSTRASNRLSISREAQGARPLFSADTGCKDSRQRRRSSYQARLPGSQPQTPRMSLTQSPRASITLTNFNTAALGSKRPSNAGSSRKASIMIEEPFSHSPPRPDCLAPVRVGWN